MREPPKHDVVVAGAGMAGLSGSLLERFFRPFLGGIFLERELVTSSRMFEFVSS